MAWRMFRRVALRILWRILGHILWPIIWSRLFRPLPGECSRLRTVQPRSGQLGSSQLGIKLARAATLFFDAEEDGRQLMACKSGIELVDWSPSLYRKRHSFLQFRDNLWGMLFLPDSAFGMNAC